MSRELFGKDTLVVLLVLIAAVFGGLLWSHHGTGFNYWEDDFNLIRYDKTGTDGCSTVFKPFLGYGEMSWKVLTQPPGDFTKQFNNAVRSLPHWIQMTVFRLFGSEDLSSQTADRGQFLCNYLLYGLGIILFYWFAALTFGKTAGWLAAMFFSVSPINAGFLGWAAEAADPIAFVLMMICVICHTLIAKFDKPPLRLQATSLVAFLLLTLTKESFLSLWAVIAAIHLYQDFLRGKSLAPRDLPPRYSKWIGPYLAVILIFALLHRLYYGASNMHAQFDFAPRTLIGKLVIFPYAFSTVLSLNIKGALFAGGHQWLVDGLTFLFWSASLLVLGLLLRTKRIPWHVPLFCAVLFHAGSLHLALMRYVDVDHQRWLLYAWPGAALLMAVSAQGLFSLFRNRIVASALIVAAYLCLFIGMLNNHGAYLQEGYLESVRIPRAVKSAYPSIPDKYRHVYFCKKADLYFGKSRVDRRRTINPAGFYAPLALQYWYPKEKDLCAEWYPVLNWKDHRNDALYIVYDYDDDALHFYEGGDAGELVSLGRTGMGLDR